MTDLDTFIDLMGLELLPYQKRILEAAVANKEIYIIPTVTNKSRFFTDYLLSLAEKGEMNISKNAEWWTNECGGMFCSNCGHFHDDYFERPPILCPECKSHMITHDEMYIDKGYRLWSVHSTHCIDESEYPDWLLRLKNGEMKNDGY